jgi:RimJ/RimL family protein N-acetyltransferase
MVEFLQSDKIMLRPLTVDDAVHYARLLGDDSAAIQMTATIPDPCTEAGARAWIEPRLNRGEHLFAILSAANHEMAGALGLIEQPGHAFVLGYWVGRIHTGQGFATEAVRLAIELARSFQAKKLLAETFPENIASGRVLTKSGFVLTGTTVHNFPQRGGWRTNHQYELRLQES